MVLCFGRRGEGKMREEEVNEVLVLRQSNHPTQRWGWQNRSGPLRAAGSEACKLARHPLPSSLTKIADRAILY